MTEIWIDRMLSVRRPGRAMFLFSAALCVFRVAPANAQLSSSAYRVLGQPDLRQNGVNVVQGLGLNTPLATAIDVRGGQARLYIADTENARVLAWQNIRSYQMGDAPALVLGQPGPQYSNPLGTGNTGLNEPAGLAVAPLSGDLYVADYGNNRVVRFPSPFDNPQRVEPDAVFGQPNFTTRTAAAPTASLLNHPRALAFDSNGNLWVADAGNNRILRFAAASLTATTPAADTVIGQKDFQSSAANGGGSVSSVGLDTPNGLAFDAQNNLYVADFRNGRVLKFAAPLPPGAATPAATLVWGQTSLTARVISGQASATTMAGPTGLCVDSGGNVIVAVPSENRVLIFPPDGSAAKTVIGQPDFTTASANTGAAPMASASSLSAPADVKLDDAGNLFVADSSNHRVLQFAASAKSANLVWGQPGFRANGLNQIKPGSLYLPFKAAVDYSAAPFPLYVADANNNRVLIWKDAARFHSGDPADLVIGQPDLFSGAPNVDSASQKATSLSLRAPTSVAVSPIDGALFVSDTGNNRVLRYPRPVNQSGRIAPDAVFGQPDFTSSGVGVVGASTLNRPFGLAVAASGALFVADSNNNRVLEFAPGAASGAAAIRVFGQPGMNSSQKPTQASAQTLAAPQGIALDQASNLYVADTGAYRVLIFPNTDTAPPAGAAASFVIGQQSFRGSTSAGFASPADVSTDSSGNIYVADTAAHRVLVFPSILFLPSANGGPSGVIGQADLKTGNPNWDSADGLATPDSLYAPSGVWVDRQDTLYVADTGNNRVLHFLKPVAVVNAATLQANTTVARGSLATLFTAGLISDPSAKVVDSSWPKSALNRQVVVNYNTAAPLWYLDSAQVNFQVPSDAPLGANPIAVQVADTAELIAGGSLLVTSAAPGIFTTASSGSGQAAAVNQDGTLNGPSNPALAGSTITLYGTGQGQVTPPVADGVPASGALSNTIAVPTTDGKTCLATQPSMCVAIGSAFGQVTYSGLAPGFVGLWQINVVVPRGLPAGATPIRILINGAPSNLATISIR